MKVKNLTGLRFGKLSVLKKSDYTRHRKAIWTCFCDCGNVVDVLAELLVSGRSQSCGCLRSIPRASLVNNSTLDRVQIEL